MKKLKNKVTEIASSLDETGKPISFLDYSDIIKTILDNPPKEGWDTSEMSKRLKIESKLEKIKTGSFIDLEDAEFDAIFSLSQPEVMKWRMKHKDLVMFMNDLHKVNSK